MEFEAVTIAASKQLAFFRRRRRELLHLVRAFCIIVVLSCTFFRLAICGPFSVEGVQKSTEYELCGPYRNNYDMGSQNLFFGDANSDSGNPETAQSHRSICTSAHLFCFPSTLPGFSSEELKREEAVMGVKGSQSDQSCEWTNNSSWSSDFGMFKLFSGRTISCSLVSREGIDELSSIQNESANQIDISSCRGSVLNQKSTSFLPNMKPKMPELGSSDDSSSVHVKISPPVLDWGKKYMFSPSMAFLTVESTINDSILRVYEPFSTDIQFYPCNVSEVLLGPGEVASICFVFLPRRLGFSSAHLILQTSLGGFLLQAKGFAMESPYNIQPQVNLDVTSSGSWRNNFSLFNPFDETLYVEEVTAWISVSLENISRYVEAVCSLDDTQGADELSLLRSEDWMDVKIHQFGWPLLAMRPHRSWEIAPRYTEIIIETDFAVESEGKYFGVFCMKLLRSSQDKSDMVMVPLEAELPRKEAYDNRAASISVSLEALDPCDAREAVFVAISLENGSPFLLSVVKISEITEKKLFQIKYMEGLLLFPGTVTQAAVITCTHLFVTLQNSPPEVFNMNMNKLVIMTNDSSSAQIEVPCQDIINICSRHQRNSYIGYDEPTEKVEAESIRTGSLGSRLQFPSLVKIFETAEADELVLGNWKSQGTTSGMSVLDDHEVLFPMVQVGTHSHKWITVKNPSPQPVVMQLILNSGEIIDECRGLDGFVKPPSSGSLVRNESFTPSRYGFSIAESTLTEAYVHPYGRASFGPIFFHPSNRCGWRSSALIRNNLSGVEWLSLRGFGGSLSLVLLEESEPVHIVEFHLHLPVPFNISHPDKSLEMGDVSHACSQPLSKVLYIKNSGDLPLDVRKIEVSGTECGLNGFVIHSCKGFALEPGESTKILISYKADFSAAMIHGDLELALGTGILAIPMKATIPIYMLNVCHKSMFWMRVKKLSVAVLAAFLIFLVFCFILFQVIALGSQDDVSRSRSEKTSIPTSNTGKSLHCNQRDSKFQVACKISTLISSVREDGTLLLGSIGRHSKRQGGSAEQGITSEHTKSTHENARQVNALSHGQKEKGLTSPLLSKSIAVESLDTLEVSQPGNLTVRTGKEKGRRRRKRKGAGAGLTGLVEVSSSQSGNSTPSSPLSPFSSVIPKRMSQLSPDADQSIEARNPFARVTEPQTEKSIVGTAASNNWLFSSHQQPSLPRKTASKPALLPSATFPSAGRPVHNMLHSSPFLAETSTVAPHARAPGSKLYNQKTLKTEEKERLEDEYLYDIWGDHFCGFRSRIRANDEPAMSSSDTESNSSSFFVRGPQSLINTPQPRSVSDFHQDG